MLLFERAIITVAGGSREMKRENARLEHDDVRWAIVSTLRAAQTSDLVSHQALTQ